MKERTLSNQVKIKNRTIFLITGGIDEETIEGLLYYNLFKRSYLPKTIKLVVLYNLAKNFPNNEDLILN